MNDMDSRTENADIDNDYEAEHEPRTVTANNTKPSILDRIEKFDGGKYNSISSRKSSELDI